MHLTETALVFADLSDAHASLIEARYSPKEIRRSFVRFIDLSQKLTSSMRKDSSTLGAGAWVASKFLGWTNITALLKHLRNEDQHGRQIYISVTDRRYFLSPWHLEASTSTSPIHVVLEGTWELPDQLLDAPPEGIELVLADPKSANPSETRIPMLKIERFYTVQPRSEETKKLLTAAGTCDVHQLATSGFNTLSDYYAFFVAATSGEAQQPPAIRDLTQSD